MANELFTLLKQDHDEARHLMEDIIIETSPDKRHGLFIDLSDSMQLHMQIEETNFYPKLEGHKVLAPAQKDALREHQEARDLFHKLDRMDIRDAEWEKQFRLLQQGLLKHMQVEEGYVFEKSLDIFSEEQFREMAQRCREQKKAGQRHEEREERPRV